jgi:hypothetical protein
MKFLKYAITTAALKSHGSIRHSLPGSIDGIVKYPHRLRRSICL